MEETEHSLSNLVREENKISQSQGSTPKAVQNFQPFPRKINKYPMYKVSVPLSIPSTKIIEIFEKSAIRKGFVTQDKTSSTVTCVFKKKYSLKNIFSCFT
jgi:hypothetical protein